MVLDLQDAVVTGRCNSIYKLFGLRIIKKYIYSGNRLICTTKYMSSITKME